MSTQDQLQYLMTEIGPLLDLERIVKLADGSTWGLIFGNGLLVKAEFQDQTGRLLLHCDIGPVQESRKLETYELLLQYNACWRDTGGVFIALPKPGQGVALVADITFGVKDVPTFIGVLNTFVSKAEKWRDVLVSQLPADAPFRS